MKTYKDIVGDGGSDIISQVTEQHRRVAARLSTVKHTIAIMSGKGGVGKSSMTVNLASSLRLEGLRVGILDADLNGPSIAKMTGVQGSPLQNNGSGIMPAVSKLGIKVMSMDLFLPDKDAPLLWDAPTQKDNFTWRGMMEAAAMREFLGDTEWGELDYLLIDLPPGTDKLPNLVDLLPDISGTVIITLPSAVSRFIVGKSIQMATGLLNTPVIGLVENMSTFVCPDCGEEKPMFPASETESWAAEYGVPFLGKIPFDPRMSATTDSGATYLEQHGDTMAAERLREITGEMKSFVE